MLTSTNEPKAATTVPDQRLFWDDWHRRHSAASHPDHAAAALEAFTSALLNPGGRRVLEVGCGQGRESLSLARAGFRVSAFDHSSMAIEYARRNSRNAELDIAFEEHDACLPFPYESDTFAGVFSHLSLHYFDDQTTRAIFREIGRVLEFGGLLFFTVRSVDDPLYGRGDFLGPDMYCLQGHVRHFFGSEYVQDILAGWNVKYAELYDTSGRTVNPGVFLKVLAANFEDARSLM